ncbi:MAG: flagellar hook-associated protein FlgK [Hyphomonas sp.]
MSLSSAINSARSGLQVSSQRAETVATNVANAATPGYVRRSVSVSETIAGQQTTGVTSNGIVRAGNEVISGERRELSSDLSQSNVLSSAWASLSTSIGDTSDGAGLFQSIADFESAITVAAATPESTSAAANLLSTATGLTQQLNSLSTVAIDMRREADREIATGVETVNTALRQIQELNSDLAAVNPTSEQASVIRDERGRVLDQISEYISIQTYPRESGAIDVLTTEGVYLVAGTARQIEFDPSAVFQPDQTLAGGQLSGISVEGIDLTPGANSFGAISSGMFGALFQLRDTDVPQFSAQLDAVADDLITRLSDDSIDPTKTPGEYGLFVDPSPLDGVGVAGRIAVNAAVDPAQGGLLSRLRDGLEATGTGPEGNATILNAMLNAVTTVGAVSNGSISGSYSSTELAAHISSLTGQSRISHESINSSIQAQHQALQEAELSETGVDIDVQMQDLLLIEQAYAANARVIEVASQMINRLMEL